MMLPPIIDMRLRPPVEAWTRGSVFRTAMHYPRHFFSFKGELEILAPGIPKDFQKIEFAKEHLTQRWLDGRNLKLKIYREREGEPHGYVDIVIEAWPRKDEEDQFRGGYTLTIFDMSVKKDGEGKTTTLKGRVTCSAG